MNSSSFNDDYKWRFIKDHELISFKNKTNQDLKQPTPFRQFSHLFNAYSKYINAKHNRTGSLFEKNFRRIEVNSPAYFKKLVIYIHQNPQTHGMIDNFRHYPWSSFSSILSIKPTRIKREVVLGWFNDQADFIEMHCEQPQLGIISDLIFE